MVEHSEHVNALIRLHLGLDRLGPGDDKFSKSVIDQLPELPPEPRIADLGCGAGAGTLILADKFRSKVKAVDFSREFLDQLLVRARQQDLEQFVEVIECDIGKLDWRAATLDLIWSEGAAYNITFKGALEAWRPLLVKHGVAVISEMNYFSAQIPRPVTQFMQRAYPGIKTESDNVDLINASGFEVLGAFRLPSTAWWDNYYDPLRKRISAMENSADHALKAVIRETQEEMDFFKAHETIYGYTYFLLRAA